MSFNEEIHSALINEPTITALIEGVYYNHLPGNYDIDNDGLVYESFISEAMHTVTLENYGDEYMLNIKAISKVPEKANAIGVAVKNFLRDMAETTNIRSIAFQRDFIVFVEEDDVHVLTMDFIIDYSN